MNIRGPDEIHTRLLQDLANDLPTENFEKLKNHCKGQEYGRLGAGQLERIKTPAELFQKLQQKAIFKEGDYSKLKSLLSMSESEDAIERVKDAEKELLRAGRHVVGYSYPGSDAARQNYIPQNRQYVPEVPNSSQFPSGQLHSGYYAPHGSQLYHKGHSPMMPQQPPAEKSDASPSMSRHQNAYQSGDNAYAPPAGNYNQPNVMLPGNQQYPAPLQQLSPMEVAPPGGMPNPNYNQSCGRGNLDNNQYYDTQERGYILFINNYFKRGNGARAGANGADIYEYREGAEKDTDSVRNCANYLTNHDLDVEQEVGINDFRGILNNAHGKLRRNNYSSFILIISSHGIQKKQQNEKGETFKSESIVFVGGGTITLDEIKEKFNGTNAPFLIGKPKVFIIQACRGEEHGKGVPDRSDSSGGDGGGPQNLNEAVQLSRPDNADVLVAYATSEGTRAWRNATEGTWYIKHLCNTIIESTNRDFLDILLSVQGQIARRVSNTESPAKQMPCFVTSFTKKFRL